jgi:hypothetical protein
MKDHANETASKQRSEIAKLLASGLLRLYQRRRRAGAQNPPDSQAAGLELSPDTVRSVSVPVNAPESPTLGEPA